MIAINIRGKTDGFDLKVVGVSAAVLFSGHQAVSKVIVSGIDFDIVGTGEDEAKEGGQGN